MKGNPSVVDTKPFTSLAHSIGSIILSNYRDEIIAGGIHRHEVSIDRSNDSNNVIQYHMGSAVCIPNPRSRSEKIPRDMQNENVCVPNTTTWESSTLEQHYGQSQSNPYRCNNSNNLFYPSKCRLHGLSNNIIFCSMILRSDTSPSHRKCIISVEDT